MTIAESMSATQEEEEAIRNAWHLGDYTGEDCLNCGRNRVCFCPNGKTRCEKCNWVPQDESYAPVR